VTLGEGRRAGEGAGDDGAGENDSGGIAFGAAATRPAARRAEAATGGAAIWVAILSSSASATRAASKAPHSVQEWTSSSRPGARSVRLPAGTWRR
jgi:hypothetical protein